MSRLIKEICGFWVAIGVEFLVEYLHRGKNGEYRFYIPISLICFILAMIVELVIYILKKKQYYFYGNPIKFFFGNNCCPLCDTKLKRKMHHKVINSYSEEADRYAHFFENLNGERLLKKFDCDIKHKVFYCGHCDLEIEKKTLYSYIKAKRQIEKLQKKADRRRTYLEIIYVYDDLSKGKNFTNIDMIIAKFSNKRGNFEKIIYLAKKRQKYEQAKYFEPTKDLKKCIRSI